MDHQYFVMTREIKLEGVQPPVGSIFKRIDSMNGWDLLKPIIPESIWPIKSKNTQCRDHSAFKTTTAVDWISAYIRWPEFAPKHFVSEPLCFTTEAQMNNLEKPLDYAVVDCLVYEKKEEPVTTPKLEIGSWYYYPPHNTIFKFLGRDSLSSHGAQYHFIHGLEGSHWFTYCNAMKMVKHVEQ